MIRFIATDLDGTLLNERKEVPEETFPLIEALAERGVLFAPSSGRQYANLRKLFAPVADKIAFICEEGALVTYRGKVLHADPIPDALLPQTLAAIRSVSGLYPMLCGEGSAYIENSEQPFYDVSVEAYTNCRLVGSLNDVIGREPICKVAVFDTQNAAEHCYRLLPPLVPGLRTILSGTEWCDVSSPTADKGSAVRFVRETFGFRREECVAFGDHLNDYEMLAECGIAYVPENAYPPLKDLVRHTVPANTEGGVLMKLREILETGTVKELV